MKIYHGTSLKNLNKILTNGFIKPRKGTGNWKDTLESNSEMVYLTNSYACYFAFNTAKELSSDNPNWQADDYDSSKAVVLELDISIKNLYPDEDYLEQSSRWNGSKILEKDNSTMIADTVKFRDNFEQYKDQWKDSLELLGTVCHKGKISASKIKRVAILRDEIFMVSQPTITLTNQKHLGSQYRDECSNLIWTDQYSTAILKTKNRKHICL